MNEKDPEVRLLSRRDVLVGAAGLGALGMVGCVGVGDKGGDGGTDGGSFEDLGSPELAGDLWQTMSAYVRASADGRIGTRFNLFNPADVPQRVVIQIFTADGTLVVKDVAWEEFPPGEARHIELGEYLETKGVPLPFEGSAWIGTTPASGRIFMGLQGIGFDWYGPAHLASVHGMRDFGNSNYDTTWTDLILPKIVNGPRFATRLALLNVSGDGISEALVAHPEVVIRADDGTEVARSTLDPLPPYCSKLVDASDLLGGATLDRGTIQILEANAGLVVFALVFDNENDGIVTADHFFDRHFVTTGTGFGG